MSNSWTEKPDNKDIQSSPDGMPGLVEEPDKTQLANWA